MDGVLWLFLWECRCSFDLTDGWFRSAMVSGDAKVV